MTHFEVVFGRKQWFFVKQCLEKSKLWRTSQAAGSKSGRLKINRILHNMSLPDSFRISLGGSLALFAGAQ